MTDIVSGGTQSLNFGEQVTLFGFHKISFVFEIKYVQVILTSQQLECASHGKTHQVTRALPEIPIKSKKSPRGLLLVEISIQVSMQDLRARQSKVTPTHLSTRTLGRKYTLLFGKEIVASRHASYKLIARFHEKDRKHTKL